MKNIMRPLWDDRFTISKNWRNSIAWSGRSLLVLLAIYIFTYDIKPTTEYKQPLVRVYTSQEIELDSLRERVKELEKAALPITKVLDYIHMQESTRGQNTTGHHVYCKSIGGSNEYGYGALDNYCFGSYEESTIYLADYVQSLIDRYGLKEALCIYNTGLSKGGKCEYVRNI